MAKSISAFEGSNEVRHLNKSSVNVASGSKETSVDATKTFARTVPFSANDIGYVTVDPSLMTAEKSGVTYDITKSLENRSTNLDGDPTFFADTPKGGTNSAVDVIPVVNGSNNGLMSPTMLNNLNAVVGKIDNKLDKTRDSRGLIGFTNANIGMHIGASNECNFKMISGGELYFNYSTDSDAKPITGIRICDGNSHSTGSLTCGQVNASKVFNAVWNDYAELFERGEWTEPGDIVMLDIDSDKEQYCIAKRNSGPVIGVHSDTYAQLIGGEKVPEGQDIDHYVYNAPRFIPVGLAGRVNVKVTGEVRKGQRICLSEIPGVGRAVLNGFDDNYLVGIALENHTGNEIDRIKMLIKL